MSHSLGFDVALPLLSRLHFLSQELHLHRILKGLKGRAEEKGWGVEMFHLWQAKLSFHNVQTSIT